MCRRLHRLKGKSASLKVATGVGLLQIDHGNTICFQKVGAKLPPQPTSHVISRALREFFGCPLLPPPRGRLHRKRFHSEALSLESMETGPNGSDLLNKSCCWFLNDGNTPPPLTPRTPPNGKPDLGATRLGRRKKGGSPECQRDKKAKSRKGVASLNGLVHGWVHIRPQTSVWAPSRKNKNKNINGVGPLQANLLADSTDAWENVWHVPKFAWSQQEMRE